VYEFGNHDVEPVAEGGLTGIAFNQPSCERRWTAGVARRGWLGKKRLSFADIGILSSQRGHGSRSLCLP
jgi:hypothetical protein